MHKVRKAPGAFHKSFPRLAPAFSALILLAAAPALATQCPRGQILRVSKNICVPKGEAIRNHIFYGPTFRGPTKPPPEPEAQSVVLEPAVEPDRQPTSVAARKPKPPAREIAPSPSPYGELSLESFPKP